MAGALVVGAGPAGLAVAAVLRRRGVPVRLLERGDAVGANWRRRYDGLRLNTPRWLSQLPGHRMDRTVGRWVSRDDYVAYLERYAQHHRLEVVGGVDVRQVVPGRGGTDRWTVRTSQGDLHAAAVVLASGAFDRPVVPPWPGRDTYGGTIVHAVNYRDPRPYRGRHVLVVGAGASGLEISLLLAAGGAARVELSVRSGVNLFPRQLGPLPLALVPPARHAPTRLADTAGTLLRRLLGPDWPAPLPRPSAGIGTALHRDGTEPVVADGIVEALRSGRITLVPAVAGFTPNSVCLVDGSTRRPHVVLAATGYRDGVADLVAGLGVLDGSGGLVRGDGGACPEAPGIAGVGFQPTLTGRLPQLPSQARRAARTVLSALPG